MIAEGLAQGEMDTGKISLQDVCPVLAAATKTTLNAAEVGLFFVSPLVGPEITIPGIVGVSIAKAMTENLPRVDILATQLAAHRYAEALDGTLHYSRRIADSCLQQEAPQAVVHVARQVADLTHGWFKSLFGLEPQ